MTDAFPRIGTIGGERDERWGTSADAFGAILGRVENAVEIGRTVRYGRAAGRDQFADEDVKTLIFSKGGLQPVVQGPHFVLAIVAPVA